MKNLFLTCLAGGSFIWAATTSYVLVSRVPEPVIPEVVYVASVDCPISPHFRRGHDAAVAGVQVDPSTLADGTTVPVDTLAETLAFNYAAALGNSERLKALQDWVRSQTKRK